MDSNQVNNMLNQLLNNLMSQTKELKLNIIKVNSETQDKVIYMDNKELMFDFSTLKPLSSMIIFLRANSFGFLPGSQVGTSNYILLRGVAKALFSCKYKSTDKFVLEKIKIVNEIVQK